MVVKIIVVFTLVDFFCPFSNFLYSLFNPIWYIYHSRGIPTLITSKKSNKKHVKIIFWT
jgi:hypothetical protein